MTADKSKFTYMKKVYLDNASTTQLRPEVILEMTKVLTDDFGNPFTHRHIFRVYHIGNIDGRSAGGKVCCGF